MFARCFQSRTSRLQELNPQSIVFVINLLSRAVVSQLAMNVLEHIECESSAESNLSVVYIRRR